MGRNKRVLALSSLRAKARAATLGLGTALGGALLVSAHALAVDVRGTLRAGDIKPVAAETIRSGYWREWNGFIEPKKQSVDLTREVAVVLIGADGMKDAITVSFDGGTLSPGTIVLQKGSGLRIRNDDDFSHQLYAQGLKQFDPVETSAGASRQLQIDEEGSFPIFDKLAPYVRGHLHVLPKVTKLASPQADGSYKLSDVAPGSYTLKVFRGGNEVHSTTIEVADKHDLVVDPIGLDAKNVK
jgi:hypothetical protein